MENESLDEKEAEKQEEKETEKHEEKQQQDAVSAIVGAAFLIWLGVVLLAVNMNFLNTFTDILASLSIQPYRIPFETSSPYFDLNAVQVFVLGGALILFAEIIMRSLIPAYRRRVFGTLIGAIAMLSVGLGLWEITGPLILIIVGIYVLIKGLRHKK
jgi:hypothetical protein